MKPSIFSCRLARDAGFAVGPLYLLVVRVVLGTIGVALHESDGVSYTGDRHVSKWSNPVLERRHRDQIVAGCYLRTEGGGRRARYDMISTALQTYCRLRLLMGETYQSYV
jgi:hypothetical protein